MGQPGENDSAESHDTKLEELGRAYAAALIAGDEVGLHHHPRGTRRRAAPTAEIDDEIIAPALWLIGELWERGEISIAEEHLATEISPPRAGAAARGAARRARARGDHRVMLGALFREQHVVALRDDQQPPARRRLRRADAGGRRAAGRARPRRGAPQPGRRVPEHDDARRERPGADRDPRGAPRVPDRGVRDRRPRDRVRASGPGPGSRSACACPRRSTRSTRLSSAWTSTEGPSKIRVTTIGSTGSISAAPIDRSSGQPAPASAARRRPRRTRCGAARARRRPPTASAPRRRPRRAARRCRR